jgi:hypothetical protein
VDVAGALLTPEALSIEGGAEGIRIADRLSTGGSLTMSADRAITVGGEMLVLGTAQVRSRQDGIRLLSAVTAMDALSLEAAGMCASPAIWLRAARSMRVRPPGRWCSSAAWGWPVVPIFRWAGILSSSVMPCSMAPCP